MGSINRLVMVVGLAFVGQRADAQISTAQQDGSAHVEARTVVRRQLESMLARWTTGGQLRRSTVEIYDQLDDDSTKTHEFAVADTGRLTFLLACDADCTDLPILVRDAAGRVVADTIPIQEGSVSFRAERIGAYRVQVIMKGCLANPCYYGLLLLTP